MYNISIPNLQNLINSYEKFPQLVNRNMLLAARISVDGIRDYAKANHKFKSQSNAAENAIMSEVIGDGAGGIVNGRVWIDPNVKHAIYQHEGTGLYGYKGQAYDIFPKNGKMLKFVTSPGTAKFRAAPYGRFHKDGFTYAFGVTHPGVHGDPFVYNAAENRTAWVNSVFDKQIEKSITGAGL